MLTIPVCVLCLLCFSLSRGDSDFAHDRHELRRNLDLHWYYAVKCERRHCMDADCRYSHNDHEIMYHPRSQDTAHTTHSSTQDAPGLSTYTH